MHLSFDQCCDGPCDVCVDIAGPITFVMTLPDISTLTDLNPGGSCPECEDYAVPTELVPTDQATVETLLQEFEGQGCSTAADRTADTQCGATYEESCGSVFYMLRFAATYRTDSGDLRLFVGLKVTYQDSLFFSHTYYLSDDSLLESGAFKTDCSAVDYDGAFSMCSGTTPTEGCSAPSAFNITMAAA